MDIAAILPKRGINNGRSNKPEGVGLAPPPPKIRCNVKRRLKTKSKMNLETIWQRTITFPGHLQNVGQTHVSKMNSCLILYVVNMFYNYICKRFANQLWFPKLFANVQQIGCAFVKRTSLTDMIIRNI